VVRVGAVQAAVRDVVERSRVARVRTAVHSAELLAGGLAPEGPRTEPKQR
jgi:hypothetical protein